MYKVTKVTDKAGNPTAGAGRHAVGMEVAGADTIEELSKMPRLYMENKSTGYAIRTSPVQDVSIQATLFGSDTIEVHTANSVYHLETESVPV